MTTEQKQHNDSILIGRHHDITAFASTCSTRLVLNSVHYNADKKILEATDGRMLIRVPVCQKVEKFPAVKAGDSTLKDCIIPCAPLQKALGNIEKSPRRSVLGYAKLSCDGDNRATMVTTNLDTEQAVTAKCVEGKYPRCDQFIPDTPPTLTVNIASGILKRIAEYADKHGKSDHVTGTAITFEFIDGVSAIRFRFQLEDPMSEHPEATGVCMPIKNAK